MRIAPAIVMSVSPVALRMMLRACSNCWIAVEAAADVVADEDAEQECSTAREARAFFKPIEMSDPCTSVEYCAQRHAMRDVERQCELHYHKAHTLGTAASSATNGLSQNGYGGITATYLMGSQTGFQSMQVQHHCEHADSAPGRTKRWWRGA